MRSSNGYRENRKVLQQDIVEWRIMVNWKCIIFGYWKKKKKETKKKRNQNKRKQKNNNCYLFETDSFTGGWGLFVIASSFFFSF